jgi:hypothetical protein
VERVRVGEVAVGARQRQAALVRRLVEEAGDSIREELASPAVVKSWCESIRQGVKLRSRTEMNLYAQVMRLLGEERRITVEFIHSLGAKSEDELRRYVDAAKSVEGAGPHDGAERCVAYLEAYFNVYPEQRGASVRRMGGYVPVEVG